MTDTVNYETLEGKIDLANVLSALLDVLGGSYDIPADKIFAHIQIDRTLILDYNKEKNVYNVRVERGNLVEQSTEQPGS